MRTLLRLIAAACFLAVLAQAVLLFRATGGRLFTQLPSADLAKMQGKPAGDAFAGLGMNDLAGEPAKIDNDIHFGLLPAGPGHAFADSASILTFAGPAFVLLALTWWSTRRRVHAPP
jgi:hypothetical protein